MGKTICIASQKGGVGKSTTAVNLSTALALAERTTLLVDCDPQGHATTGMGMDKAKLSRSLYHGLTGKASAAELVFDGPLPFLKTLPANTELFQAYRGLISAPGGEHALKDLLRDLKARYDFIILDSPPSLGLFTFNAIAAADSVLIPLQCEFYALEGMGHFLKTIHGLRTEMALDFRIEGILLTMFEAGEDLSRQIGETARRHFQERVFKTIIPRDVQLRESCAYSRPLLLRRIKSTTAMRYLELAAEILHRPSPKGDPGSHPEPHKEITHENHE